MSLMQRVNSMSPRLSTLYRRKTLLRIGDHPMPSRTNCEQRVNSMSPRLWILDRLPTGGCGMCCAQKGELDVSEIGPWPSTDTMVRSLPEG